MKNFLNTLQLGAFPIVLALALAETAAADGRNPSSLLLYPQFRHSSSTAGQLPSVNSIITFTNTHPTLTAFVHVVIVDAKGPTLTPCSHMDIVVTVPACGSFSTLSSQLVPPFTQGREGFIYAYAVASQTANAGAIAFNYLTGDLMVVDGVNATNPGLVTNYSVDPVGFAAINPVVGASINLIPPASPQLDGIMYSKAPARILIPRFMGQEPAAYASELVLLSLAGTATTQSVANNIQTLVDFLVFNDNEEAFSAQYQFRCWERTALLSINGIFAEQFLRDFTNDNPNEIRLTAAGASKEAGWMFLEGNVAFSTSENIPSPAIMAFLIEKTGGDAKVGAEIPFFLGERAGRLAP